MTVAVVTGSSGFVGGHLVRRLAAGGASVVAIDRRPPASSLPARTLVADLSLPHPAVDRALRRADAVFHLAGCPGVRGDGGEVERRRWRDNVLAGVRVLETVPDRVPVVVTSSSSVYGGSVPRSGRLRPCRETDRLRPRGGYARSKARLEAACTRRAARGGLVAVARPFTVAGEGQRSDMAIARWLAAARAGRPLEILGSGDRARDVTDVRDVVEGLVRLAELRRSVAVNLGTGRAHRLADIAAAVATVAGPIVSVVVPAHPDEAEATLADTRRCAAVLGFVPTSDLSGLVRRQWLASSARPTVPGSPAATAPPAPDLVEAL